MTKEVGIGHDVVSLWRKVFVRLMTDETETRTGGWVVRSRFCFLLFFSFRIIFDKEKVFLKKCMEKQSRKRRKNLKT